MAERLPAYQGVLAARIRLEAEDTGQQPAQRRVNVSSAEHDPSRIVIPAGAKEVPLASVLNMTGDHIGEQKVIA